MAGVPEPTVDPRAFRDVLGRFPSGVVAVTAAHAEGPVGLTCQAFTSLSLDPPLVLFCPARTSRSWPRIAETGRFAVNLLAADQRGVAEAMATGGADKFAVGTWTPGPATGSPVLADALGHVECRVETVHDGGDHHVVVGRVLALRGAAEHHPGPALLYHRGRYQEID